jgi:hypothetical protein
MVGREVFICIRTIPDFAASMQKLKKASPIQCVVCDVDLGTIRVGIEIGDPECEYPQR